MPAPASIQDLSEANTNWGICGFVAAFAAMNVEGKVIGVPKEDLRGIFVSSIRKFLDNPSNKDLGKEIETFTRTFDGFGQFSLKDFLERSWNLNVKTDTFGIAMPPNGVIAFLQQHKLQGAREVNPPNPKSSNIILGLGKGDKTAYKGLKHWVFKFDETQVYNGGKKAKLSDVMAAKNWQIVCHIAF